MNQPILGNAAQMTGLAGQLNEISHTIVSALGEYEEAVHNASAATLVGQAGSANVTTTAQIKDAAMKVQHRFQEINRLLTQSGGHMTNTDEENHQRLAQIPSQLQWT